MVLEFKDAVADVFQEVPVVRHHEQGGSHRGQSCFQPRDHVQVKVVGGLVQDQKIKASSSTCAKKPHVASHRRSSCQCGVRGCGG